MPLLTGSILYVASHQSLKLSELDAVTGKRSPDSDAISKKDAMMFPLFGSLALCSLYIAYKFIGKEYMNLLLTSYIMLAGVSAVANTLEPLLSPLFSVNWREKKHLIHFHIPKLLQKLVGEDGQDEFRLHFSKQDVVSHILCLGLAALFLQTKDFTIHNLFGICFSIQAIRLVSLGQFMNAFILLWGLFVYDVFWVFGTDVMVTVALSFEAPAKIIFPQSFEPWKQGILGLGDIVIPGIFVALCLRFDDFVHRRSIKQPHHRTNINVLESFPKPYFYTVFINYLFGLGATAFAMHVMKAAQPALLYLVPFTTISVAFVALIKGHIKDMFAYTEDDDKKDEKKNEKKESAKETPKKRDPSPAAKIGSTRTSPRLNSKGPEVRKASEDKKKK
jgi:minor histocompatibility antigen H13